MKFNPDLKRRISKIFKSIKLVVIEKDGDF